MQADAHFRQPWRLLPNRVPRFYRGGLLLDQFRGARPSLDGNEPEDWLGSATAAWTPPGEAATNEGLGDAEVGGERHRVADLLASDPAAVAGAELVAAAGGPTLGVLVKLLDAAVRLPVHAHPTRTFARHNLGSFFGKAEAWIVLGTRQVPGSAPPGVRIGFARDVERDELRSWIDGRQTGPLLAALHDQPTTAGDVWFVPPGVPHAIGAGVFLLEIQEPSDFSIVAETDGVPIDPRDAHLWLGWEVMLDAIEQRSHAASPGRAAARATVNALQPLLPDAAIPFFRADRLEVRAPAQPGLEDTFVVGVVVAGEGVVRAPGGVLAIQAGDSFGLPAAVAPGATFEAGPRVGMTLLLCRPPRPADLAGPDHAAAERAT